MVVKFNIKCKKQLSDTQYKQCETDICTNIIGIPTLNSDISGTIIVVC
jgi:hypothetical protein